MPELFWYRSCSVLESLTGVLYVLAWLLLWLLRFYKTKWLESLCPVMVPFYRLTGLKLLHVCTCKYETRYFVESIWELSSTIGVSIQDIANQMTEVDLL